MKAVPGILPTLLEMICFFSTPTIDVEPINIGLLHQLMKQQLRNGADIANMLSALVVAEFHHAAEDLDHQIVAFLFFIDLRGNQIHQPLLVGVEPERVFYSVAHDKGVKGSADKIRDP